MGKRIPWTSTAWTIAFLVLLLMLAPLTAFADEAPGRDTLESQTEKGAAYVKEADAPVAQALANGEGEAGESSESQLSEAKNSESLDSKDKENAGKLGLEKAEAISETQKANESDSKTGSQVNSQIAQQKTAETETISAKTTAREPNPAKADAKVATTKTIDTAPSNAKTSGEKNSTAKAANTKAADVQSTISKPTAAKAVAAQAPSVKKAPTSTSASKQSSKSTASAKQGQSASKGKHSTPLAAGTYMIVTAKSNKRVLDVEGGSKTNGANVLLWDWHGAAWQKWNVSYDSEGFYTIKNVHTGKVLDVAGAKAGKGANVLTWQGKTANNTNQRWILEKSGRGYILKSALNQSLVLDCTGNSAANGTNIEIWKANGNANQRFVFVNLNPDVAFGKTLEDGIYTMGVSSKTSQLVEVQGASIKNGGNVDLYASNKGMNQRWSFQYNGVGLYRIVNVGSGLSLDVAGANPTAATNVLQYAAHSGKNQLWGVSKNVDGTYTLYSAINGMALDVHGASTANLANLETYYPSNGKNQKFALKRVAEDYSGTYRLFTRLSQKPKSVDVPKGSVSNGTQLALWDDNGQLNQRFVFEKVGSAYSIRPASSGKYLTVSNGKVVQVSASGKGGTASNNQLWTVKYAKNGFQIKNVGTGKVMSVAGAKAVNSAKVQESIWKGSASQKFLLAKCEMLPRGLYVMSNMANTKLNLDATGASFANGTNAIVYKSTGMNNQKFAIVHVGGGYYRVTLALGGTVLGVRGSKNGSSAKFYNWTADDSQLWKPTLVDGGFVFQNKASGKRLAAAGKTSGSDVVQQDPANAALQKWRLSKDGINCRDMNSFVKCLNTAPGSSSLTVTRAVPGFSTSSRQWKALQSALAECWDSGFDVGFISVDCNTGMTISANADTTFYGASTIKGLYATYLCEELLESGEISLGSVEDIMYSTIVYSNNDTYSTLRYNYGSQSGFNEWLSEVGVGELGLYDYYTPKTLAKAWTHILEYESSNGDYVGFWRSIFDHGDMSSINDALGCTVYSKPGWFDGGSIGYILDDAGIVKNGSGTYVLAVMSNAYPYNWQKDTIENLVRAIDNVHSAIPATR